MSGPASAGRDADFLFHASSYGARPQGVVPRIPSAKLKSVAVAALYDIHGNLPALRAILEELQSLPIDAIVVGGDVLPGPMPRECIDLLLESDWPIQFLCGNGDRAALDAREGRNLEGIAERYQPWIEWSAAQLEPHHVEALRAWPATIDLELPRQGTTLFCHATPRNDTEVFLKTTPEDVLIPLFAPVSANLVVCGHTHMPFDRRIGGKRVVNPGSVGSPYGAPGAHWLLIGAELEWHGTAYDFEAARALIEASDFPGAMDFGREVLHPRPEAEMLELLGRIALT